MLTLSLGVPRSGTILVFNILREILTRRQVEFRSVNANYPETEAFLAQHDYKDNVLMHAHNVLPEVQKALQRPDVIAFFNYRDPRDMVISMMKLHDYTFEKCMELADISFAHYRIARKFPRIMFIPYDLLVGAPGAYVFQIAQRLGIFLPLDVVAAIEKATSLDAHKKVMRDVAAAKVDVQIRKNPRRTLKESTTHFINDRHIQSGRSGRWRRELSLDQRQQATEHFKDLLIELGYTLEYE
jgi:hypothetical protein